MSELSAVRPLPSEGLGSALQDVTVVTLPGRSADFCAYLLAHFGAVVTKVRVPGGEDPTGDFALAYDRGSTVLDLDPVADSARIASLIAGADVVVSDGTVDEPPVSRKRIADLNGSGVRAHITNFGASGPSAGMRGGDLIATAASGFLFLTGAPGERPVRMGAEQAAKLGGAEAAAGILIALHERARSGLGQEVDVATRDAMIRATINALPKYRYEGRVQSRVGDHWGVREKPLKSLWRCADGWASFVRRGGALGGRVNASCIDWMEESGIDVGELKDVQWDVMDLGNPQHRALLDQLDILFEGFLASHTTEELFHEGLRRGITIAPVRTLDDVLAENQFAARDYWDEVHVAGQQMRVPAFIVKDSGPKARG
ncbi:MAG: CoA transferase [Rhodoglobus sp.]